MSSHSDLPKVSELNGREETISPDEAIRRKWRAKFRAGLTFVGNEKPMTNPQANPDPVPATPVDKPEEAAPGKGLSAGLSS